MIALERRGGTARLTLQRADRGNALSAGLVESLIAAFEDCMADAGLHTLIIDADGPDFCTGFDLGGLGERPDEADDATLLGRFVRVEHLLSILWHAPLRTVAIAHGRAFGAGADLFAACDLRVATPETQWRFPGAAFGIVLGTRRLGEQVGVARALEWVSTGRQIDAPTALAHGLATALCERDALRDAVPALCVTRETYAALRRAARVDRRAVDMDALVRSASAPGLGRRIHRYREDLRARTSLNKETRK